MTPHVRKHNTSLLVSKLLLWDLDRFMKSVIVLLIIHLLSSAFCVQSNVTGSTGDSVADSQYTAVYHPPPKKFIIEEKKEDIHINNYNVKQKVIRFEIKVKCPKSLEEAVIAPSWKALGFHFSGSTWAKLGRMHRIFMKTAKRGERNKGSISEKRSYVSHRIEVGRNEAFLRNTEDSNLTRAQGTGREAVRKKAEMLAWGHIMKSLYYPVDI